MNAFYYTRAGHAYKPFELLTENEKQKIRNSHLPQVPFVSGFLNFFLMNGIN